MTYIKKKYKIKIPKNTIVLYNSKKNILTVIGLLNKKSLKLKIKIKLFNNKNEIEVTHIPVYKISNSQRKTIKSIQGTVISMIKYLLIETSAVIYKKLNFVGVGYRAFEMDNFKNSLFLFKLGYSHLIYFKIPNNINISCLKLTKLFIYGDDYKKITQTSAIIQSYKLPEPYKGKGILYENQKIKLKEGKKI